MNKQLKRGIKYIGGACLIPVLPVLVTAVLLYVPSVRRFAVKKVAQYVSASSGMYVEAGRIQLSFPLNLTAQEVFVTDSERDTLLCIGHVKLHVRPLPLLNREISVNGLQLENVRLHTKSLLEGMEINGTLRYLNLHADRIHPEKEEICLNRLELSDADVSIRIDSIAPSDSSQTTNRWKLRLEKVQLLHVSVALQLPSESMRMASGLEYLLLTEGTVDLGAGHYAAMQFRVSDAGISYDAGNRPARKGFDLSHIALSEVNIGLDSLSYRGRELHACLRTFTANEQSGLAITAMSGNIEADTAILSIPHWSLRTPRSKVDAQAAIPRTALAERSQGTFRTAVEASIDRRDVVALLSGYVPEIGEYYPDSLLTLSGLLEGNRERIQLRRLQSELPGVFRIEAHGSAEKITNPVSRAGELHLTASTQGEAVLQKLLLTVGDGAFRLPENLQLDMQATLAGGEYRTRIVLAEQQGRVRFSGRYDTNRKTYGFALRVDSLEPFHFLPKDSILWLTASLRARGKGTDIYGDSTRAQISGAVTEMRYKDLSLSGLSWDGTFKDHRLQASAVSEYPYAKGMVTLDGEIRREKASGMLIVAMDSLDLYGLKVTDKPFSNSFRIFSELATDRQKRHRLDVTVENWEMAMETKKVKAKTVTLHANGNEDTTLLSFHTGDLGVTLTGNADMETTVRKLNAVSDSFRRQMQEDTLVRLQSLRHLLPDVSFQVAVGQDNPVYNYLQESNIFFDRFTLDASASPQKGVRMNALLLAFIKDTTRIDTVRMALWQDTTGINCTGEVIKNKFRRQEPFTAGWSGELRDGSAGVEMYYRNGQGETGLRLGGRAEKLPDGINLHLSPDAVIAFLPFSVNKDNYVRVKNARDVSANLRLDGEKNASLWLHSLEEEGVMKELSLEISRINLEQISKGFFGRMPPMQGLADVSLRYVPMDTTYMMVVDAGVDNLLYRNGRIGELLLNGVYLPLDRGQHQIDMHFFHDKKEISTLSALYRPAQDGRMAGTLEMNQLPLTMLNPFFAGALSLNGALQGRMSVAGTGKNPLLNGYLQMDTASAYITAAETRLRFDEQKVDIKESVVQFNKYSISVAGNNPFVINGSIDLHNPVRGEADLKLTANNMQLLDARKTNESIVYGKLFVDLNSTLKGPLNSLEMRGNLNLLRNTNLAYILKDSPLTTHDRMDGLVTFSYFRDTIPRGTRRNYTRTPREFVPISGLDVLLTIRVDPAVKLRVDLDDESSNRVELEGGGGLSFHYTKQEDLFLTGRYTLSDGLVKYNMPVIANKALKIKENSYIEWNGNPMDPYLNLKATERIRSSVVTGGQTPHIVNFDAGIELKQRMADLSLQFTLEAPDDATVQNQLIAMGAEERSKQSISLLLTGMYLADDGTGKKKMDMGTALNSFLQSEINNITGSLLKEVDFNFSMDSYDGTETGRRTDYAFRFSKRFYNERINVILGGLVSTGAIPEQNNTFINDASVEYRLDAGGSRYAKLFYNRQYESLLEGEITKYGTGIVFRRKVRHLYDLFLFRKKRITLVTEEDSDEKR